MVAAPSLRAGIVGCGVIAGRYAANLVGYPTIELRGVADIDVGRARRLAAEHGTRAYDTPEALLADPAVDVVVNLTSPDAHRGVTAGALEAGKHVHSEKPMALTAAEAFELVGLAERNGLRLSCSPATFMGEAQQTAMKWVRDGRLGTVRVAYAEANWGPIELWHPAPQSFYDVGALFDVGVYPLTIATVLFGPATRVTAYGRVVKPRRKALDGVPFTVVTPDFVTAMVELHGGVVLRLTTTFYVGHSSRQLGMEFHGDDGTLAIDSWQDFDAAVTHRSRAGGSEAVPFLREPYRGIEWGRAVLDLADAIRDGRPHRASARQAAHVVEILDATKRSYETGGPVDLRSDFEPPAPMAWAR
jgi:predicted dehydrogenase